MYGLLHLGGAAVIPTAATGVWTITSILYMFLYRQNDMCFCMDYYMAGIWLCSMKHYLWMRIMCGHYYYAIGYVVYNL